MLLPLGKKKAFKLLIMTVTRARQQRAQFCASLRLSLNVLTFLSTENRTLNFVIQIHVHEIVVIAFIQNRKGSPENTEQRQQGEDFLGQHFPAASCNSLELGSGFGRDPTASEAQRAPNKRCERLGLNE